MSEVVRSARRGNFFIIENSLIDHYLEKIGGAGVAVYCVLSKHADREGSTFVGLERMGKLSGLARATVSRALNLLVQHRLIRVVKTESPTPKTVYWILPVPAPKIEGETPLFDGIEESKEEAPIRGNKEEQDPSTNKTQTAINTPTAQEGAAVDENRPFHRIIEVIDREYSAANNGGKCPWKNKRSFKALGDLFQRYDWKTAVWEQCVVNRFKSLAFMPAKLEPWEFIPKLYRFADGALDQFGKPVTKSGGERGGRQGRPSFEERANEELRIAQDIGSGNGGPDVG